MEHKQYYMKKPNGTCFVHFPNFHKLTEEEIRNRFAAYGNVLTVDTRGQVSGLCFVTYESEEDVIRCLDGFRHQKDIRILKHKSQIKSKGGTVSKQMQEADAERSVEDNNSKSMAKSKMPNAMIGGHMGYQGGEKSNSDGDNEKSDLKAKRYLNNQGSIKSYPKCFQDDSKSISKSEKQLVEPKMKSHSPGSVKSELKFKKKGLDPRKTQLSAGSTSPNIKPKKKVLDPKMQRGIPPLMGIDTQSVLKTNAEKQQCSVSYTDSNENSIFDDHMSLNDFDPFPYQQCIMQDLGQQRSLASSVTPLLKSVKTNNSQCKTDCNIHLAQEVIVANIEDTFGIHYILHLFEKFNPIAASMVKTTPMSKIRYCHIYFLHWKEALATQQEFDDYSLEGKKLIVLTSQNLTREALAA